MTSWLCWRVVVLQKRIADSLSPSTHSIRRCQGEARAIINTSYHARVSDPCGSRDNLLIIPLVGSTSSSPVPGAILLPQRMLFERSEFLIDTSQKKSLRVCPCAACTCQIILVLVCGIMYHIRTYLVSARYQPATKIRTMVYVSTYVPGWGTYYVPHMYVNWFEHVCLYLVSAGSHDTYM